MRTRPIRELIAIAFVSLISVALSDLSSSQAAAIVPISGTGPGITLYVEAGGQLLEVSDSYLPKLDQVVYVVVSGGGTPIHFGRR